MKLFYRDLGTGKPLIILHGLYGSSDNWLTVAKSLSVKYHVFIPDLRNHGNSDHSPELNYDILINDLLEFCNDHNIHKTILLGHSMGGKLAMSFALYFPYMIEKLIVVDISPKSYLTEDSFKDHCARHKEIIQALTGLDLNSIESRTGADKMLAEKINSRRIRQFLLKNLKRDKQGHYSWKFNLESIKNNLRKLMDEIPVMKSHNSHLLPSLFIKGANSDYIQDDEEDELRVVFPSSRIVRIEDAGHWVHAEQTDKFLDAILHFLDN